MFIHFGINTFNDIEWSDGSLPPSSYHPTALDCDQWVRVAKEAGCRYIILVTKHHDGFCLWPSASTAYGVAASPVPTDVVGAVAAACRRHGIELGLYYSLWDRNAPAHADPDPAVYQEFMFRQLEEVMTGYGPVCELWLDGGWAKPSRDWDIPGLYQRMATWQPDCVVCVNHTIHPEGQPEGVKEPVDFQEGDGIRFWPVDLRLKDPNLVRWDDPQIYSRHGELHRLPFEHTICLSDHWNWFQKRHPAPVRSLDELEYLFLWCTRGDSSLIINVPPDVTGRITDDEAARMIVLADRLGIRGGGPLPAAPENILSGARAQASSVASEPHGGERAVDASLETWWEAAEATASLTVEPVRSACCDRIVICEAPINVPQPDGFSTHHLWHVRGFTVEARCAGQWKAIHCGSTLGPACIIDLETPMRFECLRLCITEATAPPRIAHLAASERSTGGFRPIYCET